MNWLAMLQALGLGVGVGVVLATFAVGIGYCALFQVNDVALATRLTKRALTLALGAAVSVALAAGIQS